MRWLLKDFQEWRNLIMARIKIFFWNESFVFLYEIIINKFIIFNKPYYTQYGLYVEKLFKF